MFSFIEPQMNRKFTTVDQLKQVIVEEWNKLSQRFIDRSIDEWRRRLTLVVQQQGGHIEHTTPYESAVVPVEIVQKV